MVRASVRPAGRPSMFISWQNLTDVTRRIGRSALGILKNTLGTVWAGWAESADDITITTTTTTTTLWEKLDYLLSGGLMPFRKGGNSHNNTCKVIGRINKSTVSPNLKMGQSDPSTAKTNHTAASCSCQQLKPGSSPAPSSLEFFFFISLIFFTKAQKLNFPFYCWFKFVVFPSFILIHLHQVEPL